MTAEDTTLL